MTIDGIVKVAGDEIVAKMIMIAYGSVAKPLLGLEFGDRVLDTQGAWLLYFFSSRRRHTSWPRDWSSVVCSSDLLRSPGADEDLRRAHAGSAQDARESLGPGGGPWLHHADRRRPHQSERSAQRRTLVIATGRFP